MTMPFAAGDKLGPYEITGVLGRGGMGEVYRATDTRLHREVAVKVSDERFSDRFDREARAVASLNHPHICAIHDVGSNYLVMELVEGETLSARIGQGAIPLDDALGIARQIADALEAAHEKGIIHRDLKPDNIKITPEGVVKVLDFGLARIEDAGAAPGSSLENSPSMTIKAAATQAGMILGTAGYMAPEQARGKRADKRADIWAFGVVLYEMVTGKRLFQGEDLTETLASVVKSPADLSAAPVQLRRLLQRCLEKDPKKRLRDIGDARFELEEAASTPLEQPGPAVLQRGSGRALQVWAAVTTLAFAAVTVVLFTRSRPETPLRRFSLNTPPNLDIRPVSSGPSISPDGKHIAFATAGADARLWVQDLDQDAPRELPGTDGAWSPFWSPDSESIAFATSTELRKISVRGGASGLICTLPRPQFGKGSWSPDGKVIVFAGGGGPKAGASLYEVPADGGTPKEVVTPEALANGSASDRLFQPSFAAGKSGSVLFFTRSTNVSLSMMMFVRNMRTGQTAELGPGANPVYSIPAGHLVYQSDFNVFDLWARPFSPDTLQFAGPSFSVRRNARWPSLSKDGTLTYQSGAGERAMEMKTLVWRSRSGEVIAKVGQPQMGLREFALSPDRRSVATTVNEPPDIWVQDLTRNTTTRLTFDPLAEYIASWTSTGKQVAYALMRTSGPTSLMRKAADGTGEPTVVVESANGASNADWSLDGRYMVFQGRTGQATAADIAYIELDGSGGPSRPKVFLSTPANESSPKLSPDGRFVAYVSNESGRTEVYVRPFPRGDGRWQASVNGGTQPRWRSDGKELFYVENHNRLMAVAISYGGALALGQPQPLFESADLNFRNYSWPQYDVSADGQRFLTSTLVGDNPPAPPRVHVVENWYEEFRGRRSVQESWA